MGATERGAALHGEMLGQASSTLHHRRNPTSTCRIQFEGSKCPGGQCHAEFKTWNDGSNTGRRCRITAAAMDDPDARPLSDNEWELVNPIRSGDVPVDSGKS